MHDIIFKRSEMQWSGAKGGLEDGLGGTQA